MFFGCHLSASKGNAAMVKTALNIGANTFAFFTRNPRGSKAKKEDPADAAKAVKMLEENGIIGSMSRAGCPYDNSCTESFFATLKKERIYRREYATMEEVRADMFRYIELFYNRKRLHSVLGYMSPVDYRIKYKDKTVA